jgi:hypothetical protein
LEIDKQVHFLDLKIVTMSSAANHTPKPTDEERKAKKAARMEKRRKADDQLGQPDPAFKNRVIVIAGEEICGMEVIQLVLSKFEGQPRDLSLVTRYYTGCGDLPTNQNAKRQKTDPELKPEFKWQRGTALTSEEDEAIGAILVKYKENGGIAITRNLSRLPISEATEVLFTPATE